MVGLEKIRRYRQILQRVIEQQAKLPASDRQIESMPIFDTLRDHYLLMSLGRDHVGRAHDILVHLRLKDGKVWVEWDGIEEGIVHELVSAGVPREDIVIAFHEYEPEVVEELVAA